MLGHSFSHCKSAVTQSLKDPYHLNLKLQPIPKHNIGAFNGLCLARRWGVGVGVRPWAYEHL